MNAFRLCGAARWSTARGGGAVLLTASIIPAALLATRARAALSVVAFAVIGVLAMAFFSRGFWFAVALVVAFLVFFPLSNYSANRRGDRRSRSAAS